MNDELKAIPGWPGYFATAAGAIYSDRSGEMRAISMWDRNGYLQATLRTRKSGKVQARPQPVHRLVLMAFAGQADDGMHARHLNGNSTDNRIENLAWGTPRQNSADAIAHGTIGPGLLAHHRRLSEEDVQTIRRRVAAGERSPAIAKDYGVSAYYPSRLAYGQRWSHLGS
ncbi:HNH endonuclease [[Empedobacter] haloabium]|uniref:HNH endonuclease n=1 Tax=[Empedobacter] haloabium TaxID=592317 RepID=A0ABZ1USK0_9BURK